MRSHRNRGVPVPWVARCRGTTGALSKKRRDTSRPRTEPESVAQLVAVHGSAGCTALH